mgnify:FL=1
MPHGGVHVPGEEDKGARRNTPADVPEAPPEAERRRLAPLPGGEPGELDPYRPLRKATPLEQVEPPRKALPKTGREKLEELAASKSTPAERQTLDKLVSDIFTTQKPAKPKGLDIEPTVMFNEGGTSEDGLWQVRNGKWTPTLEWTKVDAAHIAQLTQWRGDSMAAMKLQFDVANVEQTREMDAILAQIDAELASEEREFKANEAAKGRAFTRSVDTARRIDELNIAQTQIENARTLADIQRRSAELISANQITAAKNRLVFEQDRIDIRHRMDTNIAEGNLSELVRNNKALNAISDRETTVLEQESKWTFLGQMLANGGLGFFTMAMIDPAAAKSLFTQLTGQPSGNLGGPFAAAQGMRGEQAQFGQLSIPSMQDVSQGSPADLAFRESAFKGTGRNLVSEVQRLTPESPGEVSRRRA